MTVDEIRDLIDSTITTNGVKNITGQALNLALNEIVNAVAEAATTGGGGVKRLYVNIDGSPITDEQQLASNAALYTEIVTALTNDEMPPQVGFVFLDGDTPLSIISANMGYIDSILGIIFIYGGQTLRINLSSDGNVTIPSQS